MKKRRALSIMRGVFLPVPSHLTQISREPVEHHIRIDDVDLCYFEWGQTDPTQPTVLFAHATGFHARCWDRVIAALPANRHVIALDQRGHGRSAKVPPFNWESFGRDLAGFVKATDLVRIIGVGHSMGGHAVVQAAAKEKARFERLLLVDPVIMDPELYASMKGAMGTQQPKDHPTSKRNNLWQGWREMFDRLNGRGSFAVWRSDVLEDYCRYGVLPNPDGAGWVLACPPLVEAAIYTGSGGRDIHDLFADHRCAGNGIARRETRAARGDGFSGVADVGAARRPVSEGARRLSAEPHALHSDAGSGAGCAIRRSAGVALTASRSAPPARSAPRIATTCSTLLRPRRSPAR